MVGQTIGKYRVEDRIGRGGMGTVYRAVDETLHREVAIKVLNSELNDPEVAKRFRAEAITVARLSHPGIATIYELFEHDGQWLMVMEFVRGETLERLVERAGPLTAERASELAMQALAALSHAHALGVVHRDLKPANLMLTDSGTVKIMDFGIARVSGSEHLTNAGFMMGTPAYMAPEQVLSREVDARADLYAMGVVIYRLTTGRLPFKGETPFALAQSQVNDPPTPIRMARQGLPEWLEQVITISLAKAPEERFQTAEDFRVVLQRCLSGLPMARPDDPAAPTGIMLTPPGLPTGALQQQPTPLGMRAPSGAVPIPGSGTGSMPTSPSGSMPAMAEMETQLHSTAGIKVGTGAVPVPTPTGAVPAAAPVAPTPAPPAKPKAKKSTPVMPLVGLAALVLLGAAAGLLYLRRPAPEAPAPAAPAADASATPAPAEPPAAPPADAAADASATKPATPDTAAPATKPDASSAPPAGTRAGAPPAAPPSAKTATTPATPPATTAAAPAAAAVPTPVPAAPAAPPVDDSFVAFKDIKFMAIKGNDSQDQDALLNFGSGQITIVPKDGGTAYGAVPYAEVAHATYTHTKDPKWDTSLPAPPDNLQIHGFMRGTRHWLTLQTKSAYVLLRLDDANWSRVLDAVEARCRLKVDRPVEGGF